MIFQRITKVSGLHSLGIVNICIKLPTIHPIVSEIFEFGPKWWTSQQTNIPIPQAMRTTMVRRITLVLSQYHRVSFGYIHLLFFPRSPIKCSVDSHV